MAKATDNKVGAVLVVGGGIGGMQASLDLANAGFKVYLVEKSPAIGGVMSQLDKTFPTNDCAMCTLAPRMVECGNHINVEKLTYSEVESIEGKPGAFKVRVRKKARSVDPDKCTGCGECMESCLVQNYAYLEPLPVEPLEFAADELDEVNRVLEEHASEKGALLPVLEGINARYNWLPPAAVSKVSEALDVPLARVLRIATFYNMFSFEPRGELMVRVCLGTACYVKGGARILEAVQRELNVKVGETTNDMKFSLETVSCLGCCGQSPVMTVNDDIYGYLTQDKISEILASYT
ncbi:NADH-quinone oxidoreductase subunit NuoE [Candidatus Bipolaricaulota bacterium]|nr:NADH-quinone oxidoreductase subunit NuoE [Candidatus Bipolaricaulota bacterium]